MLNKGFHTDKKRDDQLIMTDSLKTNMRDFKKIFKNMKSRAGVLHKPENSPYQQVRDKYKTDYHKVMS